MGLTAQHEPLIIPAGIVDLAAFRRWSLSDEFPQQGRIDYIAGHIEVDVSPANVQRHSLLKSEIGAAIVHLSHASGLGQVYIDQTRVVSPFADLSCEPDVLFVFYDSLRSGGVVMRPGRHPVDEYDFMEIEGGPELVVEVVSPTSAAKDYERLPPAYFAAGVKEYWIADARGDELKFIIHQRGQNKFKAVKPDAKGFQRSEVLGAAFRLTCKPGPVAKTLIFTLERK